MTGSFVASIKTVADVRQGIQPLSRQFEVFTLATARGQAEPVHPVRWASFGVAGLG